MRLSSVMGTPETPPDCHLLEYVILRRRSPAVDVALAQHGRSRNVLTRLYMCAPTAVRVLACSNPSLFTAETFGPSWRRGSLLWGIVRSGPLSELRAICENPHLASGFYDDLIESWEPEDYREAEKTYLSDDRFVAVLNFLSANPRISQRREDSAERHYLDGFAEYQYNSFYLGAWKLAEKAPVTPAWANALATLYRKLHIPYPCIDDVDAVIERWRPAEETEYAATRYVREALAAAFMKPSIEALASPDPSIRAAFYRKFNPDAREFRDLDWNEWIDRDKQIYFDIANNDRVWSSSLGRSNLKAMLWHGSKIDNDLLTIGFYDERIEELEQQHPEWFDEADDDNLMAAEPLPDPVADLRLEVVSLIAALTQQRRTVVSIAVAGIVGLVVGTLL